MTPLVASLELMLKSLGDIVLAARFVSHRDHTVHHGNIHQNIVSKRPLDLPPACLQSHGQHVDHGAPMPHALSPHERGPHVHSAQTDAANYQVPLRVLRRHARPRHTFICDKSGTSLDPHPD
jgi:hypothetical protein